MKTKARGFTLIEMLIGSTLMLFVIIAALSVYSKSNQISVDQQQYTEIQHDVRSAIYLVMRDARMAGSAIPDQFNMYAIEGVDNEDQGVAAGGVRPDRLILMGNMDDPLLLQVDAYSGASASTISLADGSFEQYPYLDTDYASRLILILPNPAAACRKGDIRQVSAVPTHSGGANESMTLNTGLPSTINPPSARRTLSTERLLGTCTDTTNFHGGTVMFVDVKEYWLDITGGMGLPVSTGYIGVGGVLYQTKNGIHNPIAQNIENFQVEYNGDFNADGLLDGFLPWSNSWTLTQVSYIRQVRALILGRTANAFVGVSGRPADNIHHYRRPDLSNSPGATTDDLRRRFLLESTSNIRNLSLNLYNRGVR